MNLKAFNNIMAWRFAEPHGCNAFELNSLLAEIPARHPENGELAGSGFLEPFGDEDIYVETIDDDTWLITLNTAKRLLPGKVVRQKVEARAAKLGREENRKVFAREKQRMKEEVIEEMLPRAFVEHSQVHALLHGDYIFIGTGSAKRGEALLDALRHALGSLKVVPVSVATTPIRHFTHWFGYGQVTDAATLDLGAHFVLHGATAESEVVKGSWHFSTDETLSDWVAQGSQKVTSLGLTWYSENLDIHIPFVANEMLALKSIKWPPEIHDQALSDVGDVGEEDEDEVALARASLLIMTHELRGLWRDLLAALGGEALPHGARAADTDHDDDLI